MSSHLSYLATRIAYLSRQLPRMAWYAGHLYAMRRLAEEVHRREGKDTQRKPRFHRAIQQRLDADMAELLAQDLAHVEAGIYPLPFDHDGSLFTMLDRSRLFFGDLPNIDKRRKRNGTREVLTAQTRGRRPGYYLQNFHFQSGGWLTDEFGGTLRHTSRSSFQGNSQRHAAAGAAAARRNLQRTRSA